MSASDPPQKKQRTDAGPGGPGDCNLPPDRFLDVLLAGEDDDAPIADRRVERRLTMPRGKKRARDADDDDRSHKRRRVRVEFKRDSQWKPSTPAHAASTCCGAQTAAR